MADPRLVAVEGWLIGFGPFAAAGMLLWGVVAAVPILLHLLRRRRSRVVRWGAMQFLRAAIARRAKEFQLWRLLLLCLRVAAVLCIAVALARPLLPGGASEAVGAMGRRMPATLWVFVVDASYSMRAVVDGRSRFEEAQTAAAGIARRAPAGDGFLLLKMSNPPEPIIQTISHRPDETIAQIEALQPGEGIADLTATLAAVEAAVDEAVRAGWGGPVEVVWLSDLQEVTWIEETAGLQQPAGQQEPTELDGDGGRIRYRVVDVATRPVKDNATVVRLERDASSRAADESQQFLATVSHTAGDPIQGRLAQLVVDGNVEQSQRFDLQPDASRALVWSTRLARGRHAVEMRIGEDALVTDNTAGIVVDVAPTISIAAFGPSPAATRYIALAAASVGNGSTEVRTFELNQLPRMEIGRFDLWILCDPLPLDGEAERRIAQHLGQGGGVLWWLGPRWQEGRGGIAGDDEPAPSPDARAAAWTAVETAAAGESAIDPLDYRSAIVQPFEAFPGAGLLSLPVFRYWVLELGSGWSTALAMGDDPLVATYAPDGEGRQIVVATPPGPGIDQAGGSEAAEPWNALIAWPAFVPLVQEMIHWARADATRKTAFVVGEPVSGQTPEGEMGERLENAAGDVLDVEVQSRGGRTVRWNAGLATAAGVYRWSGARGEDRFAGRVALVVNVDPREGRLAKIDQLPEPFTRFTEEAMVEERGDAKEDERGEIEREELGGDAEGREIYWWVLMAAAGLLIAESVVVRMLEGRF